MIDAKILLEIIQPIAIGLIGIWGARQQILRVREKRAAERDKAEQERETKETVARLEREKIDAEARAKAEEAKAEKAAAEARRILNESEGELLKKTAEANQTNQLSQLMVAQQLMLADTFKQISQDNAQSRLVYDRVAENLNKQAEAIAMIGAVVQAGNTEVKTELNGLSTVVMQAIRDFPSTVNTTVNTQVSPLGAQLRQVQEMLGRLTSLVQGAQLLTLIAPAVPVAPSTQSSSDTLEEASHS